jgi:phospholipid N-methyltransferase
MATAILFPFTGNANNMKLANRFRSWADALESKILHATRPLTQNPTPKRNREYQSRMLDARNMERTQKALRVLADAHENGSIPEALAALTAKDDIRRMVSKYADGSRGGYYSVIESDDFRDQTPSARLLQAMIDVPSAQRIERDRLRRIDTLAAEIRLSQIPGYFPTPASVVDVMLDRARIAAGMRVLEPSAGSGNIADEILSTVPTVEMDVIEPVLKLQEILRLKGHKIIASDLHDASGTMYDRIVMNPPFEKQQDIDHVRKAFSLLRSGGILVSIMSPSFEFRSDRKSADFREWLKSVDSEIEELPDGSFKTSGTGVSTRLVVIERS